MRYLILSLTVLFLSSCTDKKRELTSDNDDNNFLIDSVFIDNYEVRGLKRTDKIENIVISDHDEIYSIAKTKMEFYEYKSINLNDSVDVKIILTAMSPDFIGDGTLKIAFLTTVTKGGRQIDIIRIGKRESISDTWELEESTIDDFTINKRNQHSFLDMDSLGHGIVNERRFTERFNIKSDGKIVRM